MKFKGFCKAKKKKKVSTAKRQPPEWERILATIHLIGSYISRIYKKNPDIKKSFHQQISKTEKLDLKRRNG